MATFKFGNGDNLLVNVNTNGDTYIAGNGNNDTVNADASDDDVITLGSGVGDVVNANTDRLCMPLKRVPLLLFGGIVMAARHMAAMGRRRAERTVAARFVAGRRWSDLTERTLNDELNELTGQSHRSFLP